MSGRGSSSNENARRERKPCYFKRKHPKAKKLEAMKLAGLSITLTDMVANMHAIAHSATRLASITFPGGRK